MTAAGDMTRPTPPESGGVLLGPAANDTAVVTPVKVDLIVESLRGWPEHLPPPITVRRMLPFVQTSATNYVHRPRSARLYDGGERLCVSAWCGQGLQRPRMMAAPPEGSVVCATCEGRAVGAGQVAGEELTGVPLMFSPRWHQYRCGFEARTNGGAWGYVRYDECGKRATGRATKQGEKTIHVCVSHAGQALRKGYTVTPVPDWRTAKR